MIFILTFPRKTVMNCKGCVVVESKGVSDVNRHPFDIGPKPPKAGCIITCHDKYLFVQTLHETWGFPKGSIEKGETEVECAVREVREETGVDVNVDENKYWKTSKIKLFLVEMELCGDKLFDSFKQSSEITGIALVCVECVQNKLKRFNTYARDYFFEVHDLQLEKSVKLELMYSDCKFGDNCRRTYCKFRHTNEHRQRILNTPNLCRFGLSCRKEGCTYNHELSPLKKIDFNEGCNKPCSIAEFLKPR